MVFAAAGALIFGWATSLLGLSVGRALIEIDYQGYISAEVLPYPDSLGAAKQSLAAMRQCVLEQQPDG